MYQSTDVHVTAPKMPGIHLFSTEKGSFMLDVEQGKILEISEPMAQLLKATIELGDTQRVKQFIAAMGLKYPELQKHEPPASVRVHAFSLAIAQKCNLGCTYCYAEQGTFGGKATNMELDIAKLSVDSLLQGSEVGEKITIAYMGGEPLFNRAALYEVTEYAVQKAMKANVGLSFAITTNATLTRQEDIELFQKYRFCVTVSIDGAGKVNDLQRPYISGKGSFEHVAEKIKLLVAVPQRQFELHARVTVTPKNLNLPETLQGLLDMGFDTVKFSPMLSSPAGKGEMEGDDLTILLEQMIACGEYFKERFLQGEICRQTNVVDTLKRIHNFQREQYPCGAGGGYMGVSSEGKLYACHRFVNDTDGEMGDVVHGVDAEKQQVWLQKRHLSAQGHCNSCWARYMCSGSCHYEVLKKGRPACDYIRGWLHYCLGLYIELLTVRPEQLLRMLGEQPLYGNNERSV